MPAPGPRTTYRCSDHFKATAARLSELPGISVRDVADPLYIHPFMLSRWRKRIRKRAIVTKGIKLDKAVAAEPRTMREVERKYEPAGLHLIEGSQLQ
ncbi:transposase [Luteimonas sp. 3794]|uniref:transposase n=1 Tax=Luteimonas sp. 3794 TaxID=2817730 RepID=UPI002865C7B2|nr:transposase [Luteimonas sp. 3794]MDR6992623.1 transposase [Luteimonas sp. 3794]